MKYLIPMILSVSLYATELEELTISDLTPKLLEQVEQGTPQFIIHCQEGDELPIKFEFSGDVLALHTPPENNTLKVLQPFYIKFDDSEPYFSLNKEDWLKPGEFFTGNLSLSLVSSTLPYGTVSLETYIK